MAAGGRLAEYQFSREEAAEFALEGRWRALSPAERGLLQLRQDRLCMDFAAFHQGVAALLGRPVYTHEFAQLDLLWEEYQGVRDKPDLATIVAKLPEHLRRTAILIAPTRGESTC